VFFLLFLLLISSGGGVQTQTVTCMQTQNGVRGAVVASACSGTQPQSQRTCNTAACAGGQWVYGAFSECSKTVSGQSSPHFAAVSVRSARAR